MLSAQKIESNKKKFLEVNEQHEIFSKELLEFLGEDFFLSPASTTLDMNNACPGGLLDHLLKVCKYAIYINKVLPEKMRQDERSVLKVSLLSEIGKTFLFTSCESEWHRKNQGKMYEFKDNLVSMKIGERSAYYAFNYQTFLTEIEYQAIVNIDKGSDDKQARWFGSTLAQILKQAIDLAILEEKECQKN